MSDMRLRLPAKLPAGLSVGGVTYMPDADGCIVVPELVLRECLRHGLVEAPPARVNAAVPADEAPAPKESRKKRRAATESLVEDEGADG